MLSFVTLIFVGHLGAVELAAAFIASVGIPSYMKMTRVTTSKEDRTIDLAQGVMDLHSKETLILNLKPFNFLLNENDSAILGDIGIPYLLLGISLPSIDMIQTLGTLNCMAPKQWQPDVIGPLSFECDSWGFGCSIVEMLTGIQPWSGKSIDDTQTGSKEARKPQIPSGLHPAVENVIIGCFEYDFMSRPMMADILHAFKR